MVRLKTKVKRGGYIRVQSSSLHQGEDVDVIIVPIIQSDLTTNKKSILEIISNAPENRNFKSVQQVDDYIKGERDSWDR